MVYQYDNHIKQEYYLLKYNGETFYDNYKIYKYKKLYKIL